MSADDTRAGEDRGTGLARDLRRAVRGPVSVPGDAGFEAARTPWKLTVDQRVRAVVEIEDAADASALVRYAAGAGLALAVQPNGHGAADGLDGEILVRTGRMRRVEVRPDERTARVAAGASWGEVLAEAAKYGLTGLCGSSPAVSAVGYTLGGGLSWFGRRHGLAANGVRSFDVVDAEGASRTVSATSDPELFWALRGGGGDFALVTSMEIELHPAPELYGGRMVWPAARAAEVLTAFRDTTTVAPEELTVWFTLIDFPPFPELPEPLRGLSAVTVDLTFLGDGADARRLLHRFDRIPGLVFDTRGTMAVPELGAICAEPTAPTPAILHGELLDWFDDAAASAFLAAAAPGPVAPLVTAQIRHLGGALARPVPDAGACGHLAEPYLIGMLGIPRVPADVSAIKARQASVCRALAGHTSGSKPFTYLLQDEPASAAFPEETLARLRQVKRRYDPHGIFRANHPVLA
ncbi:FAD-binding oxidoreductase [Sphaerisporangium album]|uniref:FAD-binding oxidoreductase n=1 Tax=Sphaerisporangium album TaxID=509200 RepID=A0A367FQC5_9ACTN|nr:FAD-binding oxidoreductase [Sphaerisporangium album]RCG32481.1 FAD-binding oxidoreductase [Sphaerisporangium album]